MSVMRPTALFWTSLAGLALLTASLHFAGASSALIFAVFVAIWFALIIGLALVSDRRYVRAFDRRSAHSESTSSGRVLLSIGRAILIGEMIVNVPVVALLVGVIAGVAKLLAWVTGKETVGPWVAIPVIVAFTSAWAWWSIVTPRWLLWAMRRVEHPRALRNAAVGSILWDNSRLGQFFNRTQWRTAAMRAEEQELLGGRLRPT